MVKKNHYLIISFTIFISIITYINLREWNISHYHETGIEYIEQKIPKDIVDVQTTQNVHISWTIIMVAFSLIYNEIMRKTLRTNQV
jgi:hypothetical protein